MSLNLLELTDRARDVIIEAVGEADAMTVGAGKDGLAEQRATASGSRN